MMMSCGHSGVLANRYTVQNSRGSVASVDWLTVKTSYKKGRGLGLKVPKGNRSSNFYNTTKQRRIMFFVLKDLHIVHHVVLCYCFMYNPQTEVSCLLFNCNLVQVSPAALNGNISRPKSRFISSDSVLPECNFRRLHSLFLSL